MIFDSIVNVFFNVLTSIFGFFPTLNIFGGHTPDFSSTIGAINNVSCIMPVGTFFIAMGIWLILSNFNLLVSIVHWVLRKVPGIN